MNVIPYLLLFAYSSLALATTCKDGARVNVKGTKCGLYMVCKEGEWYLHKCQAGEIFDEATSKCQSYTETNCADITPKCEERKTYSHPASNHLYYQCLNGRISTLFCAAGEYFETSIGECRQKIASLHKVEGENYFEAIIPSNSRANLNIKESCIEGNKHRDGKSCRDYIECIKGRKVKKTCPDCMNYDEVTKRCKINLLLPCGPNSVMPTPFPDPISTTQPTPEPEPSSTIQPSPEPEPTSTNQPSPEPEPTSTSQPTPEPEPTSTSQPSPEPEPTSTSQPSPEPDPSSTSQPSPEPDPSSTSQTSPGPEPISTTQPSPEPEPTSTSQPSPEPEPTSTSQPSPGPEPISTTQPTPEPQPISTTQPTSEPQPTSTSQPSPEPDPSSTSQTSPEPDPSSTTQPSPGPEPISTTQPTPEPTSTSQPSPEPEPTSTSQPSPEPEPTSTSQPTSEPEPTTSPQTSPETTQQPTSTSEPTSSTVRCSEGENIAIKDPKCKSYKQCVNGKLVKKTCFWGFQFDVLKGKCIASFWHKIHCG